MALLRLAPYIALLLALQLASSSGRDLLVDNVGAGNTGTVGTQTPPSPPPKPGVNGATGVGGVGTTGVLDPGTTPASPPAKPAAPPSPPATTTPAPPSPPATATPASPSPPATTTTTASPSTAPRSPPPAASPSPAGNATVPGTSPPANATSPAPVGSSPPPGGSSPSTPTPPGASPPPASPPPPPPPCPQNVAPFCRIFLDNVLCNATTGLVTARPWLAASLLCTQPLLRPLNASCWSIKDTANASAPGATVWPFDGIRYIASWQGSNADYSGSLVISIDQSLPECGLEVSSCTYQGTLYSKATAPAPLGVTVTSPTALLAAYNGSLTCIKNVWEAINMGWTDTGGNGKCQQQDLASLPQGFIGGGWVTYQGEPNVPQSC